VKRYAARLRVFTLCDLFTPRFVTPAFAFVARLFDAVRLLPLLAGNTRWATFVAALRTFRPATAAALLVTFAAPATVRPTCPRIDVRFIMVTLLSWSR
jgi:hypothetical protein